MTGGPANPRAHSPFLPSQRRRQAPRRPVRFLPHVGRGPISQARELGLGRGTGPWGRVWPASRMLPRRPPGDTLWGCRRANQSDAPAQQERPEPQRAGKPCLGRGLSWSTEEVGDRSSWKDVDKRKGGVWTALAHRRLKRRQRLWLLSSVSLADGTELAPARPLRPRRRLALGRGQDCAP